MIFDYEKNNTLEYRKEEVKKIMKKYDDKIPVIIQFDNNFEKKLKTKYLVNHKVTLSMFINSIRKHCSLKSEQAIFLYINGDTCVSNMLSMGEIYKTHKVPEWNILKIYICKENCFG